MRIQSKLGSRIAGITGRACVLAALALLSPGIHVAHAGDAGPAAAPTASATAPAVPPASPAADAPAWPFVHVDDVENARRPGVSGVEVAPGVVVLNTRGFNYGPPPTPIAPEAMRQEGPPATR